MSATITIVDDEITAEMQRAQEAEEELSNRITVNSEGLAAEISRATSSENSLSNRITVNAEGLAAEITRATTAESNEASRATEAEESLSNRITVTAEGLSAEIIRATSAETTETNRAKSVEETLSNNISVTSAGLSAEITRATTAETTETGRAKAAEETLTNNLSITASNLTSEIQRASTAEGNLGSRIDQTEAHILTEVQKGLNGEGGYTSIYQDATQVATIVSNNAYTKKAGITIESDGIHMYSSQSSSNSTVDITPSAINLKTANLNVNSGNSINIKNSDGTNAVYLNNSGINLYSGKTISISSGASINVASGGKFTIVSTNFNIDNNGNVFIKGEVEASSGTIGGWTIGPNSLYSGTGSSYVALSTTGNYAIWAGNATASSAPFRVNRDGTVYSTKLITVKEDGTEQVIDLSKYSLWKLNYKTIKSVNTSTGVVTLSDNSTFNSAASVTMSGSWDGNTFIVTASNGKKYNIEVVPPKQFHEITYTPSSNTYYVNAYAKVANREIPSEQAIPVVATQAYNAGVTDGRKSATLTAGGWVNGTNKVTNDYNSDKYVNVSLPLITSYNSITLSSTDTGTAVSKWVTANIGDTTRSAYLSINAKAVYNAGVSAGEAKFSSAGELYTVSSGNAITPIGTAIPLATYDYYDVGSSTTLYKGNGGAVYDVGASGNWYRAGTIIRPAKRTGTLLGTPRTITQKYLYSGPMQPTGTGATYYVVANATPVYLAGDDFEYYDVGSDYANGITPIGTKSEATTKYDRGDSVTPTRRQGTRINTSPVPASAYRAGTDITPAKHTDYYTKTS